MLRDHTTALGVIWYQRFMFSACFLLITFRVRSTANLAQFTGQSTANIIAQNMHSYSWTLWISSVVSLVSFLCAMGVLILDKYLRTHFEVVDYSKRFDKRGVHTGTVKTGTFRWSAVFQMPLTFWFIILFAIFENAGVQSFVSISTSVPEVYLLRFLANVIFGVTANSLNRG